MFIAKKVLLYFKDVVVATKDLQAKEVDLAIVAKKAQTQTFVEALNLKSLNTFQFDILDFEKIKKKKF